MKTAASQTVSQPSEPRSDSYAQFVLARADHPRQIAAAAKEAQRLHVELTEFGRTIVDEAEIREARRQANESRDELIRLRSPVYTWLRIRLTTLELLDTFLSLTRLKFTGWLAPALVAGVVPFAIMTVSLLFLGAGLPWIIGGAVVAFLLTAGFVAGILLAIPDDTSAAVQRLRMQWVQHCQRLVTLTEWHAGWSKHLRALEMVRDARDRYERAREYHQQLVDAVKCRRYQLLHSNWRAMRGVPFEDFIAEVFLLLGYAVTKTKTTGDQGVDLVVAGKGRIIAVQTKGYEKSVGNSAVQEVHAGLAIYQCQECLVVTNSRFTSSAWTLAAAVGCRLVEGKDIPDLIDGRIY